MGCGCGNNNINEKDNNKILNLDDIKNMSLDNIVRLYRNGYKLETRYQNQQSPQNPQPKNINQLSNIYSMQYNSVSIIDPPTTAIPGQSIKFNIRYNLYVPWVGEWVRFRICYNEKEIGDHIVLLFGSLATGNTDITVTFPNDISGNIIVRAEVTTDELSSTCGDSSVMAMTAIEMNVVTQAANTISLINLPSSVNPGWSADFQISYNLSVSGWGEWVRFRICAGGNEIGSDIELLFGDTAGIVTISTTIPSNASGSISIKAEVTQDELNSTCGDPDVMTTDGPVNIPVGSINSISLVELPDHVGSGRSVYFSINYSLSVSGLGEWVRFRICDSTGKELGDDLRWLIGNTSGGDVVTTVIPTDATGSISIKAEVTTNELSSTCGDPDVIAYTNLVTIPVTIGNVISITNAPASVKAGQNIDLIVNYNIGVDSLGEWVKFRICTDTGVEIASNTQLFFGNVQGNVIISTQIPPSATGTIKIKAEVTLNELSSTCGDSDVVASTDLITISVVGSVDSITVSNMPATAAAGQQITFTLDYNLPSISLPEIVRFRICANGGEIGSNIETLILNTGGSTTVDAKIPDSAINSILLRAEVTKDEFNSSCGDPDVVAKTSDTSVALTGAVLCTEPQLYINGERGTIYVKDIPTTIELHHCGSANSSYIIARTDILPNPNVSVGTTDANGTATITLPIDLKGKYSFQSGEGCLVGGFITVCNKLSNEVTIYAGVTPEDCIVTNPLSGQCLISKSTLTMIGIGIAGLAGLYLVSKAYFGRPKQSPAPSPASRS